MPPPVPLTVKCAGSRHPSPTPKHVPLTVIARPVPARRPGARRPEPVEVVVGVPADKVCGLATPVADTQACAVDSDCTSGTCTKTGGATTGTCGAPAGTAALGDDCTADADCDPNATAPLSCKEVVVGVPADKVCGLATPVADTQACAVDSDCTSGNCDKSGGGPTGSCAAAVGGGGAGTALLGETCDTVADCSTATATPECKELVVGVAANKVCGLATQVANSEPCAVNSDCTSGNCDKSGGGPTGSCASQQAGGDGTKVHGETCTANGDCNESLYECKDRDASVKVCALKTKAALGADCAINADCTEGTCIKAASTATLGKCVKTIAQTCSGDHCATGLTCRTATPRVCIRTTPKSVPVFGACAVPADCEDGTAAKARYCEKADLTTSKPGQCVELRALGVECSVAADCASDACSGEPKKCAVKPNAPLIAATVTLPPVAVVANQPKAVTVPGGVNLQLTPSIGGNVAVVARGEKQESQPTPPGNGVGLFLSIDLPTGATVTGASLDFEYLEEIQEANNNIPGEELTWYTFNEEAEEWQACDEEKTTYDADTRILSCATDHFSDWTISTKVSAAFAAYMPHLLTVIAATALSLSMGL
ncbi:hypothetical protein HDU85_000832 [Gaertneriomyces sp. JEL0708]|nr:hypothetical protein HDU85_000832 [Gaertneriomyces sp. JEL0708]